MTTVTDRLRPMLITLLGLLILGVSATIPIVEINSKQAQGWEAVEYSFRFMIKDFPRVPLPAAPVFDTGSGLSFLGLGSRPLPSQQSPMDGVMVSTAILASGGFKKAEGMGTVFLAWVSWSWLANLGVITALVLLLAGPRMVRKIRWLLEIIAWLSVLLAALGAFVVLGWGEEPLLFGPAYWAWLAALVVMGIGVSLTPHGQRQPDVTGEQ